MFLDVLHVFSAVALYETRAPYASTLLRGRSASDGRLKQVAFAGNHGNLGWISKRNYNPLILAPLAWMIQQLYSIGMQFDDEPLDDIFAGMKGEESESRPSWIKGNVFRAHGYEHLIGRAAPNPGRIVDSESNSPAVDIHSTVRLRGYGRTSSDPAVPGYRLASESGSNRWVRTNESTSKYGKIISRTWPTVKSYDNTPNHVRRSTWPKTAPVLEEAPIGELEARLLGLTV